MLKFDNNQLINVSKTFRGENFYANILANVNNTLIITRPYKEVEPGKFRYLEYLAPRSMLYGDYEFDGVHYYFRTIVIKSSYTPFPHVILKEPEKNDIKTKILRKASRYKTILPLRISETDEESHVEFEEVYSLDISLTGIGILSYSDLPNRFNAKFFSGIKDIQLTCEVKKKKKNIFDNFNLYGCEIVEISDKNFFERFINNLRIIMETK